jgi:hypothetical protein
MPPICSGPVGLGANLTLTFLSDIPKLFILFSVLARIWVMMYPAIIDKHPVAYANVVTVPVAVHINASAQSRAKVAVCCDLQKN